MLLDQDLPGLDGRTILGRLTDTGVLAASRVIMLTATRDDRNARAALAAGAHDHLVKPA